MGATFTQELDRITRACSARVKPLDRMSNVFKVLVIILVLAISAYAHEDTLVPIRQDRSIPEITSAFSVVFVEVDYLGGETPYFKIKIGGSQLRKPIN
jgi:hypothetical protein